jgi:DNA-binding transcriptional LysR family regulator
MLGKVEKIQVFLAVANQGAFGAAARQLNLSPSVVTRLVAELEAELGVQLLVRTTRKVALTQAGRQFLVKSKEALNLLQQAEAFVRAEQNSLAGDLRVNAPLSFGLHFMATVAGQFRAQHPQVKLKLSLTDSFIDILTADVDMALRISEPPKDKSTIWRKICPVPRVAVASPHYLAERGTPREPKDLRDHMCLGYGNLAGGQNWVFTSQQGVKQVIAPICNIECDNGEVLADLAAKGEGITILPKFIVKNHLDQKKLKVVLTTWTLPAIWLTAYYPPYVKLPAKVAAFTTMFETTINASMPTNKHI